MPLVNSRRFPNLVVISFEVQKIGTLCCIARPSGILCPCPVNSHRCQSRACLEDIREEAPPVLVSSIEIEQCQVVAKSCQVAMALV